MHILNIVQIMHNTIISTFTIDKYKQIKFIKTDNGIIKIIMVFILIVIINFINLILLMN